MYKLSNVKNESLQECKQIMKDIYEENPSYWPHGLSLNHHDDVYLIREKNASEPVGFVGLQKIPENDGTYTGYYTVGVRPEFRKKGFAKVAIQTVLKQKEPEVNRFKALVMSNNEPSINLAKSLGVEANVKSAKIEAGSKLDEVRKKQKEKEKEQKQEQKEKEKEQKEKEKEQKDNASTVLQLAMQRYQGNQDQDQNEQALAEKKTEHELNEIKTKEEQGKQQQNPISMQLAEYKENSDSIKNTFYGKTAHKKSANFKTFLKGLKNSEMFKETAKTLGGSAAGYGVSEGILNPTLDAAGTSDEMQNVNTVLNVLTGALFPRLARKGLAEKTLITGILKEPALMAIDPVYQMANKLEPSIDKAYDASSNFAEAATKMNESVTPFLSSFQGMSNSQKALAALTGAGLLGAGVHTYNESKKDKNRKRNNVAFEIPSSKVNDDFYSNLGRTMLFDSEEDKIKRIDELEKDLKDSKKEKKTASINLNFNGVDNANNYGLQKEQKPFDHFDDPNWPDRSLDPKNVSYKQESYSHQNNNNSVLNFDNFVGKNNIQLTGNRNNPNIRFLNSGSGQKPNVRKSVNKMQANLNIGNNNPYNNSFLTRMIPKAYNMGIKPFTAQLEQIAHRFGFLGDTAVAYDPRKKGKTFGLRLKNRIPQSVEAEMLVQKAIERKQNNRRLRA